MTAMVAVTMMMSTPMTMDKEAKGEENKGPTVGQSPA